jgi:hypothetical protein
MVNSSPDESVLSPEIVSRIVGWARVPPLLSWKHPGLPRDWSPVVHCPPDKPRRRALPGWLYLFQNGEVREIDRRFLEVVDGVRRPS